MVTVTRGRWLSLGKFNNWLVFINGSNTSDSHLLQFAGQIVMQQTP